MSKKANFVFIVIKPLSKAELSTSEGLPPWGKVARRFTAKGGRATPCGVTDEGLTGNIHFHCHRHPNILCIKRW
jgi:hypothetical protein